MRNKYYYKLKRDFFSDANAVEYVKAIKYLVSEQAVLDAKELLSTELLSTTNNLGEVDIILEGAYLVHEFFLVDFFKLDNSSNNPKLLCEFATAYATLLQLFSALSDKDKNNAKFKQITMTLLSSIGIYDQSNQLALTIAEKIIDMKLPTEFCLAALMQVKVNTDSELQQKVISILEALYSKDSVFTNVSTPLIGLSTLSPSAAQGGYLTPNTQHEIAALMHDTALTNEYCARHAHKGNIAFLLHMQACWFAAGNKGDCQVVAKNLSLAVSTLSLDQDKESQWRDVLEFLATYPKDSMQQRWRAKIVQTIMQQHGGFPKRLESLGINPGTYWTLLFSARLCAGRNESYTLDEPDSGKGCRMSIGFACST